MSVDSVTRHSIPAVPPLVIGKLFHDWVHSSRLNDNILQTVDCHIEVLAHTLYLFTAHVADDLPLKSYTESVSGPVVVRDATLVSWHDTAGRCNVSCSLDLTLWFAIKKSCFIHELHECVICNVTEVMYCISRALIERDAVILAFTC